MIVICPTCKSELAVRTETEAAKLHAELHAQSLPTPADEDKHKAEQIASRLNELLVENYEPSLRDTYNQFLVEQFTTALAEARRAGTPTTDARAKSVVDHLFTILARDYNIELTNNDASEMAETVASAFSSTPSNEVAQRARED